MFQLTRKFNNTFLKYLAVGMINTLSGISAIYILKWFFEFGDISANAVGYTVGLIISFFLNRNWSFKHSGDISASIVRFSLVILLAYSTNLGVVLISIHYINLDPYIAQATGVPFYTAIGYLGSKYFVFTSNSESKVPSTATNSVRIKK